MRWYCTTLLLVNFIYPIIVGATRDSAGGLSESVERRYGPSYNNEFGLGPAYYGGEAPMRGLSYRRDLSGVEGEDASWAQAYNNVLRSVPARENRQRVNTIAGYPARLPGRSADFDDDPGEAYQSDGQALPRFRTAYRHRPTMPLFGGRARSLSQTYGRETLGFDKPYGAYGGESSGFDSLASAAPSAPPAAPGQGIAPPAIPTAATAMMPPEASPQRLTSPIRPMSPRTPTSPLTPINVDESMCKGDTAQFGPTPAGIARLKACVLKIQNMAAQAKNNEKLSKDSNDQYEKAFRDTWTMLSNLLNAKEEVKLLTQAALTDQKEIVARMDRNIDSIDGQINAIGLGSAANPTLMQASEGGLRTPTMAQEEGHDVLGAGGAPSQAGLAAGEMNPDPLPRTARTVT